MKPAIAAFLVSAAFLEVPLAQSRAGGLSSVTIPYSDAGPILSALREDLIPQPFRGKTPQQREVEWPAWAARSDAAIRARLAAGDADSVVNWLLFGVTFTKRPRVTARDLDGGPAAVSDLVRGRIDDMLMAMASPAPGERLEFAREVIRRAGVDMRLPAGNADARRYLEAQATRFVRERQALVERAAEAFSRASADPNAGSPDLRTFFRDRGLSSDTTMFVNVALDVALTEISSKRIVPPAFIRRVAIIGPGLDFTDKSEGYDFYPVQTIQPFAIIDSLVRLGLADLRGLHVSTFDLSPRINAHLERARERALRGESYELALPLDTTRKWTEGLLSYWNRFGERIGKRSNATEVIPGVSVRNVLVRPDVVKLVVPLDLDVVFQRTEPRAVTDRFDLIVATNILVYYDVFQQALALANVARMLRPGGLFLVNGPVFELPATPIHSIGSSDAFYYGEGDGRGPGPDRIHWYQRQ